MVLTMLPTVVFAVENPFSDVSSDSTLAQAVMWAYENSVTAGTSDTTFSPDETCTRGQVVTFLWRSQGDPTPSSTENPFTDVVNGAYYYEAVLWAVEMGITAGTSDTAFSPDDTCTTAQVLTFLYRANGEPDKTGEGEYYDDAINWATDNGLTNSADPESQSPRSDIVTYLWRNAGTPVMEVTSSDEVTEILVFLQPSINFYMVNTISYDGKLYGVDYDDGYKPLRQSYQIYYDVNNGDLYIFNLKTGTYNNPEANMIFGEMYTGTYDYDNPFLDGNVWFRTSNDVISNISEKKYISLDKYYTAYSITYNEKVFETIEINDSFQREDYGVSDTGIRYWGISDSLVAYNVNDLLEYFGIDRTITLEFVDSVAVLKIQE